MAPATISFFQINLHNSYRAQEELECRISEIQNPSIAFIQEPPLPNKKLKFPKEYEKFQPSSNTRVNLFIPPNLQFTQIASLTTSNSMAALGKVNNKDVLLVSLYIPPKNCNNTYLAYKHN